MGKEEIRISYRRAKDKEKQIGILAELNLCTKDEIVKVLQEGREDTENKQREQREPVSDVLRMMYRNLELLDKEIRELEERYKETVTAIKVLHELCGTGGDEDGSYGAVQTE